MKRRTRGGIRTEHEKYRYYEKTVTKIGAKTKEIKKRVSDKREKFVLIEGKKLKGRTKERIRIDVKLKKKEK